MCSFFILILLCNTEDGSLGKLVSHSAEKAIKLSSVINPNPQVTGGVNYSIIRNWIEK